jgi:hypothetical protein
MQQVRITQQGTKHDDSEGNIANISLMTSMEDYVISLKPV